jgi:acyl-CoA synthetase (AMP-forming)/AMP-acid ligase II
MSPQAKNYVIAFLACTTLGAAALVVQTRQQLADVRDNPSLEIKRSDIIVAAAPAPLSVTPPVLPAALPDAPVADDPAAERLEPGQGRGQRGGGQFSAQMAELMQDPEFAAAMKLEQEARLDARYGALFKQLNLPPAQLAELKALLAEREAAGRDVWMTAREQGLDPRANRDQLRELSASLQDEVNANIKANLGETVYNALETYNATSPQRETVAIFERRLQYSQPLNSAQSAQLTTILANTGTVSGRNVLITDATISQAAGVLTSDQLTDLRAQQAEQQARLLIEAKTRAAREAARANRAD